MYNKKHKNFPNTKKEYVFIALFILAGSIMIGHGFRMIYHGIFDQGSSYSPNYFDVLFDWLTLALLGFFVLAFALFSFYKRYKANLTDKKTYVNEKHYQYPT